MSRYMAVPFVLSVAYAVSQSRLSLFSLHPLLMSLTVVLGFQAFHSARAKRISWHLWLAPLALLTCLVGVYAVYAVKSSHWTSWHGLLGLVAVCWAVMQSFAGMFNRQVLNNKAVWPIHRLSGVGLLLLWVAVASLHVFPGGWLAGVLTGPTDRYVAIVAQASLMMLPILGVFLRPSSGAKSSSKAQ